MKIFRNNKCYVEFENLAKHGFPSTLELDKDKYEKGEYAVISDPEGIEYMKDRIDIIDYDDVKDFTIEELDKKIEKTAYTLEKFALRFLETPRDKRYLLFKDKESLYEYYLCEDIYYPLINYRNKKEEIDEEISMLVDNKTLIKERN